MELMNLPEQDMELKDLPEQDLEDLKEAKTKLEYPSLTAQISNVIGKPIEGFINTFPESWKNRIGVVTHSVLLKGLETMVSTFPKENNDHHPTSNNNWHKLAAGISGGVGGLFGLVSVPIELPISTLIMLRSIIDIAQSEGHDIHSLGTKLSCIEVFALGGANKENEASETGYWVIRATLARQISEAAAYVSTRAGESALAKAPPIMRLIASIASRFSVQVSEEVAAKAIPIVGAASGGVINLVFIGSFQNLAKGHFIIKRLEKKYGMDNIKKLYNDLQI